MDRRVKLKGLTTHCYQTEQSAGFDIHATEGILVPPRSYVAIPTGLYIEDWCDTDTVDGGSIILELQLRPRSSLIKRGLILANSPSTIDGDYRGEIKILIYNTKDTVEQVLTGDRLVQGVFALVYRPDIIPVKLTTRGTGGFGSTGDK